MGNYIQYLIITYNVKDYEKEFTYIYKYIYIYVCVLNHFAVHLKHCKSTIPQLKIFKKTILHFLLVIVVIVEKSKPF